MTAEEFYEQLEACFAGGDVGQADRFLTATLQEAGDNKDWVLYLAAGSEMIGFYGSISAFEKAFTVSENILLLLEELQLEDTEQFAAVLLNVAAVYQAAGRLAESYEYSVRALQIYERLLPAQDARFAELYRFMSLLLEKLGEEEKAELLLTKALAILSSLEGKRTQRAVILTELALLKCRMQQLPEAKEKLEEALVLFEKEGPETDPHYGAALAGAGEVCFHLEEYEAAFSYYQKSLAEVEKHFGRKESYVLLCDNCAAAAAKIPDREAQERYEQLAASVKRKQ